MEALAYARSITRTTTQPSSWIPTGTVLKQSATRLRRLQWYEPLRKVLSSLLANLLADPDNLGVTFQLGKDLLA